MFSIPPVRRSTPRCGSSTCGLARDSCSFTPSHPDKVSRKLQRSSNKSCGSRTRTTSPWSSWATSAIWRASGRSAGEVRYNAVGLDARAWYTETNSDSTEGEALAQSFGCKFIETSAKSRINVDTAFHDLVREIRRFNREMQGYSTGSGGSAPNGAVKPMDVSDNDAEAGCCSKCVIM